jgi:hypothetical protein
MNSEYCHVYVHFVSTYIVPIRLLIHLMFVDSVLTCYTLQATLTVAQRNRLEYVRHINPQVIRYVLLLKYAIT